MTETDAHLARVFYAVLVAHARSQPGQSIRYKELIARARRSNPNDEVVGAAIPIGVGRRLEVIVQFAIDHNLPPLTCLAVNDTGRPGASYRPVNGTWQADMEAVAKFDWSQWQDRWDTHVEAVRKAATPLKRRSEKTARDLVHQAFVAKKIPRLTPELKEQLVSLLMDGLSLENAAGELGIDLSPS